MQGFHFLLLVAVSPLAIGCQAVVNNEQNNAIISQFESQKNIEDYLSLNLGSRGHNGKSYCAYKVFDVDRGAKIAKLSLFISCQEYYKSNGKLKQGTGSNFHILLTVEERSNGLYVKTHRKPRDGAGYDTDMRAIFSERARNKFYDGTVDSRNQLINKMQKELEQDASRG